MKKKSEILVVLENITSFASTISATLPIEQRTRAELLFLAFMKKYNKQPLEIHQQIAVLKERKLIFHNEKNAYDKLKQISYFRLANYWKPMEQDKVTHVFKPQSTFENALNLYYFDKELRNNAFSESLKQLIRKHPNIDIKAMGFSEVWMKEALWSEKRI